MSRDLHTAPHGCERRTHLPVPVPTLKDASWHVVILEKPPRIHVWAEPAAAKAPVRHAEGVERKSIEPQAASFESTRSQPESKSMSLKAKIEAVIYAAEEPVTLAQMVGLLGHEAQAELDRTAAGQQSLALDAAFTEDSLPSSAEPDDFDQEVFGSSQSTPGSEPDFEHEDLNLEPNRAAAPPQREGEISPAASTTPPSGGDARLGEQGSVNPAATPQQLARDEREHARALREFVRSLLDELIRDYSTSDRGLEIREVAGGFRLATKPEYHDAVRGFVKALKPPLKLTLQALETLAVVAYKQPVTAPEVSEIRGVDSGGVLGSLMARKLVTTAGRKPVIGRPILYKTTKDFLLRFGLKDINELPSIEEFEKMAGELADTDSVSNYPVPNHPVPKYSVQEEISMPYQTSAETAHTDPEFARLNQDAQRSVTGANLEEEKESTEPQADGDGATVETVTPDGRLSGITPPQSTADDTDTSAAEAEIQQREQNT